MIRRDILRGLLGGAIAGPSAGRAAVQKALNGASSGGLGSIAGGVQSGASTGGPSYYSASPWRVRQLMERYRRAALEVQGGSADPAILSKRSWSPVYKAHVQAEETEEIEALEKRLVEDSEAMAAVARALGLS